jgi:hypothetical protein
VDEADLPTGSDRMTTQAHADADADSADERPAHVIEVPPYASAQARNRFTEACPDCPRVTLTQDMDACPECGRRVRWVNSKAANSRYRKAERQRQDAAARNRRLTERRMSEFTGQVLYHANRTAYKYGIVSFGDGEERELADAEAALGTERMEQLLAKCLSGDDPPAGKGVINKLLNMLKYAGPAPAPAAVPVQPAPDSPWQTWIKMGDRAWSPVDHQNKVHRDIVKDHPPE